MPRAKVSLRCPLCHNKDFAPKGPYSVPILNIGGTERTRDTVVRRYTCLQCGYSWKTIEQFYDDLEIHGDSIIRQLYEFMKLRTPKADRKNLPSLSEFLEQIRAHKKTDPNQIRLEL